MAKGGTRIFCKSCGTHTVCRAISPTALYETYHRRIEDDKYEDIKWFRRGRECLDCGERFLTAEVDEDFIKELVLLRDAYQDRIRKNQRSIIRKCSSFLRKENIAREYAEELIRKSAYWDHPTCMVVAAPKHAERIYMHALGWAIDFGANTFLPGLAIERCARWLKETLKENSRIITRKIIINKFERIISGCVADSYGDEYYGYYPEDFGYLVFGTQLISLASASEYILSIMDTKEIFI